MWKTKNSDRGTGRLTLKNIPWKVSMGGTLKRTMMTFSINWVERTLIIGKRKSVR